MEGTKVEGWKGGIVNEGSSDMAEVFRVLLYFNF